MLALKNTRKKNLNVCISLFAYHSSFLRAFRAGGGGPAIFHAGCARASSGIRDRLPTRFDPAERRPQARTSEGRPRCILISQSSMTGEDSIELRSYRGRRVHPLCVAGIRCAVSRQRRQHFGILFSGISGTLGPPPYPKEPGREHSHSSLRLGFEMPNPPRLRADVPFSKPHDWLPLNVLSRRRELPVKRQHTELQGLAGAVGRSPGVQTSPAQTRSSYERFRLFLLDVDSLGPWRAGRVLSRESRYRGVFNSACSYCTGTTT